MINSRPDVKFAVVTTQRSGSAWLISMLNGVNNTTAYGELFLRRSRTVGGETWDSDFSYPYFIETPRQRLAVRPASVFSYLSSVYHQPGAVGFKIMYSQLRKYPEVMAYFFRRGIRVVHLVRRNYLDAIISNMIRKKTGRAHVLSSETDYGHVQITLEPRTLVSDLRGRHGSIRRVRRLLRWLRLPHIEVTYEDLCRDESQFSPIWEFLGINPSGQVPPSNMVKMRKGSHVDVIRNYRQVKAALAGSPYADLID